MKIVKIKSSQGGMGKAKGAELGPDKIVEKITGFEIDSIPIVEGNLDETHKNIYEYAQKTGKALYLGGDHSISYGIIKAMSEKHPDLILVILDAHPDCEVRTQVPSHEDFVRGLVEEEFVKGENICLIGLRNISQNEKKFIEDNNIKQSLKDLKGKKVYLSIDIDVLDPNIAPGTGYPESAGLQVSELLSEINTICKSNKVICADIVEVNPKKDENNKTIKVAADISKEILKIIF